MIGELYRKGGGGGGGGGLGGTMEPRYLGWGGGGLLI